MKNLHLRFSKQIIQVITGIMFILAVPGFFGTHAYSQITGTTPGSRCGEGTVTLGATASSGTIKWYSVPFYGTAFETTGETFITPSLAVSTYYYVDAVDANGCSLGDRVSVLASINSSSISSSIFYASSTFCKTVNTPQPVTRTGSPGGVFSAIPSGLSLNASTGAILPSASTENTYTVTYTVTPAPGCSEPPVTVLVTITSAQTQPAISYTGTPFCTSLATVDVSRTGATGGTYSASSSGLTIDPASGTITPTSSQAGNYTVTYLVSGSGGCTPLQATTDIAITELPTASIAYPGAPYCKSIATLKTPSLTGTGAFTGGTYSSTPNTLGSFNTSTGAFIPSGSTAGTYTIHYLIPASGNCATVTIDQEVKIFALPTASIAGDVTVCQNAPEPLITFTGLTGAESFTFTYTVNNGGDQTVTTTSGNTVTVPQPTNSAGTYIYKLYSVADGNGCAQPVSGLPVATITVSATPVATFSYVGSPFCKTGTATPVFGPGGTAGTFTSIPTGVVFGAGGVIDLASTPAGTYEIYNTITSCGDPVSDHHSITILSLPTATLPASLSGCATVTLTATTDASPATYKWYKNDVLIPDQTNSTLVATATDNYKVRVTDGTTGCEFTSLASAVTIIPLPTASITGTLETCNTPTTLTAVTNAASPTYVWYKDDVEISGQTAYQLTVSVLMGSGYYKVKIRNGSTTCENTSVPVLVIISASDVAGTIAGGQTVCTGNNSTSMTLTGTKNNVVGWEYSVTPFTAWTPITNLTGYYTATGLTETTHYRVVEQAGTCPILYSAVGIVTVVPDPTIATQPAASTSECIGGTAQLSVIPANGTGGYIYQWYDNGSTNSNSGGSAISGATNDTYTPPTASAGTVYYYVIVGAAGSGCGTVTSTVAAVTTVTTPPQWANYSAPTPTTLCVGGTVAFSISVTGVTVGTISWIRSATSGGAGTTVVTGEAPPVGTWYYRPHYTPSGSGCTLADGPQTTVTVVADPTISVQPAIYTSICVGGTTSLSVTAANGTGAYSYQWQFCTDVSYEGENFINVIDLTPSGVTYLGGNTATLTVTFGAGSTPGDRWYRCVVSSSGAGCTSVNSNVNNGRLHVALVPSWNSYSFPTTAICIGGSVTFSTSLLHANDDEGGTIDWIRSATPGGSGTTVSSTAGHLTASGTDIPPSAGTWYYRPVYTGGATGCGIADGTETTVTVAADPTIATQPVGTTICQGGSASLSVVAANGTGTFSYQWEYNIGNEGDWHSVSNGTPTGATYSGATTANMTVSGITGNWGNNEYRCVVTSSGPGCTSVTSASGNVPVVSNPTWSTINSPTPTTLCVGGTVAFSASISGGAGGTISWIRSATSGGAGTTVVTGEAPPVGTWYYRPHYAPTGSGCTLSDGTQTTVVVNAIPSAPTGNASQSFCGGN